MGELLRLATRRVHVQPAKAPPPVLELPFWGLVDELLVPERDDTALRDVEGKLRAFARGEEVELEVGDFGAKVGSELFDGCVGEEGEGGGVAEGGVGCGGSGGGQREAMKESRWGRTGVDVLERHERRELHGGVEGGEEASVFVRRWLGGLRRRGDVGLRVEGEGAEGFDDGLGGGGRHDIAEERVEGREGD